jgi:hypothetical protein
MLQPRSDQQQSAMGDETLRICLEVCPLALALALALALVLARALSMCVCEKVCMYKKYTTMCLYT